MKHIAVVEDDLFIAARIEDVITHHFEGVQVKSYHSVDEFWSAQMAQPFDIAVLDIMMARGQLFSEVLSKGGLLTGALLLDKLKQQFAKETKVIISTGIDDPDLARKIILEDHAVFFAKPYNPERLIPVIEDLLAR